MGYFFDYECQDKASIIKGGGVVNENADGSVSVFVNIGGDTLTPIPMTKSCCEAIDPSYTFDVDTQKCKWSSPLESGGNCAFQPFKIVLNPKGNDGVIFTVDENDDEDCTLDISFDYLMQFDCGDIVEAIRENTSQSAGLTKEEQEQINALQIKYDDCIKQTARYEQQLVKLETQLSETPYVIECLGTATNEPTGVATKWVPDTEAGKYDKLDTNYKIPPRSFDLENYASSTKRYCLTDAGLLEWETILGTNTYNSWTHSNGTDTSLYGCEQVNALVALDNKTGQYLGTCDVSLTARDEITKKINEIKAVIKRFNCEEILIKINSLQPDVPCSTVTDMLETLDVCMTLDMVNPSTGKLETVYEESILNVGAGNLPGYLETTQPNTGFITTGATGTTFCGTLAKQLMEELQQALPQSGSTQIQDLVQNSFDSEWLNFETSITDQTLLDMIYNERIKVSLFVKDCCVDFAILIDRIRLDRNCSKIKSSSTTISRSPSFDMIRVCDNKKSWLSNEDPKNREFDLRFRDTHYDINNYKLAINSKEVDLDINPANAIEQDLFCYIADNACLLECPSGGVAYECPAGTSFNTTKTECVSITVTAATVTGTPYTAVTGDALASVFDRRGAVFMGDVYNRPWPLEFSGNSGQVGLYSGTNFVIDADGEVVNAEYGGPGTGSTYYGPAPVTNSLWGNTSGGGRMNNAGIKSSTPAIGQFIGFSYCVDVPVDGTYQVGLGADDQFTFKLNGESVFEQINPIGGVYPFYSPYSLYINHFWVFGLDLKAGKNIIEMEYKNTGGPGNLTAEIYTATTTELAAMTTTSELSAVTIFSTGDLIGEDWQLSTSNGYSCPTGYALDTCIPPPYQCSKIEREDPTPVSGDCCCQGEVTTITETACGCFEKIFYDTLNGQYSPLSGYSLTTNWSLKAYANCDELLYSNEFFVGNGSTEADVVPNGDDYAAELEVMSGVLGFDFSYDGTDVTLSEVNNCAKTYLNNGFRLDLDLTICACYAPYVTDCGTMSGLCETISGDTLIEYVLPDFDFMDDAQYKPSCELLETYGCYDEQEDEASIFRQNRDAYLKDINGYHLCVQAGFDTEYCTTENPNWNQYDFYYSGLTESETAYSGYSVYNVIGPMRKTNMNWWNPISYYSGWTNTLDGCTLDPTYSASSLSDIFTGITDVTYLSIVDYSLLSGITGNIGDLIQTTGATESEFYWSPTANQWDEFGTVCYDDDLENLLTERRAQRDAYLKAKNQLALAIKPFLWSSVYIPEFQVNKYIL